METTTQHITFNGNTYSIIVEPAGMASVRARFARWVDGPEAAALLNLLAATALLAQAPTLSAHAYVREGAVWIETMRGTKAELTSAHRTLDRAVRTVGGCATTIVEALTA
jgi:uncharacterized lipoprotein YddW (UPF0748 family)